LLRLWSISQFNADQRINIHSWFVELRWIVAILQLLALIPGYWLGIVHAGTFWQYLGVMLLVPLYQLVTIFLGRAVEGSDSTALEWLIFCDLILDSLQLSVLLFMTGGWANPFSSMILLYACLGAIALYPPKAILLAVVLAVDVIILHLYRSRIMVTQPWVEDVVDIVVELFVVAVLMFISSSLFKFLMKGQEREANLVKGKLRMDRLKAVGVIASGVCHQISTPINNIRLRIERLRRVESGGAQLTGDLDSIATSLNKASDALKRLANIQVDSDRFITEKVNLEHLLKEVVEKWSEDNLEKQSRVDLDFRYNGDIWVPVSPLVQSFLDLLDNAFDALAMPEALKDGRINIVLQPSQGDLVEVRIEDDGPGFSSTVLRYMGEPFNTEKSGGSGLGLYHAQLVAQLLGGELLTTKRAPQGACVIFVFNPHHQKTHDIETKERSDGV